MRSICEDFSNKNKDYIAQSQLNRRKITKSLLTVGNNIVIIASVLKTKKTKFMEDFMDDLKAGLWIVLGIILLFVVSAVLYLGGGKVENRYIETIEKERVNIERENFEESKAYVHSMVEDLSKYKMELAKTEDMVERDAIITYINENYATLDPELIDNESLRVFLNDVMEGRIK